MKQIVIFLVMVIGFVVSTQPAVIAANGYEICGEPGMPQSAACQGSNPNENPLENRVQAAINQAFIVIGMLAVAMIIYGGISYTMSAGSAEKITKAKNVILYSVVGLIVVILASAIVNYVIANI